MYPNKTCFPLLLPLALLLSAGCEAGDGNEGNADGGTDCTLIFYADTDGDGYGDPDSAMTACELPDGYSAQAGDCDDSNPEAHPSAAEVCDGVDNSCNGLVDSLDPDIDLTTTREYYQDADGDGFGDDNSTVTSCDKPAGYVLEAGDCDDSRALVNPGQIEICDGLDNDCDGLYDDDDDSLDLATATSYYLDADGDGYGQGSAVVACSAPSQHAAQAGDCNDSAFAVNPGQSEICDGLDNDCDGGIDGTSAAPNQCTAFLGVYTGSYAIRAQEKLGNTVINDMPCNGTASVTIDLSTSPAVRGVLTCQRVGGLILFDSTQSATIAADIDLDGNLSGTLVHEYNSDLIRTYSFSASLSGNDLDISGTGSLLPHPMSAVPWQVTYSVDTSR